MNWFTQIINGNFFWAYWGRGGAVGVFVANGFAGGFFAVPQSFEADTDVSYGRLGRKLSPRMLPRPALPLKTKFLTGSDGTGATSVNVINFNNAINEKHHFRWGC